MATMHRIFVIINVVLEGGGGVCEFARKFPPSFFFGIFKRVRKIAQSDC